MSFCLHPRSLGSDDRKATVYKLIEHYVRHGHDVGVSIVVARKEASTCWLIVPLKVDFGSKHTWWNVGVARLGGP